MKTLTQPEPRSTPASVMFGLLLSLAVGFVCGAVGVYGVNWLVHGVLDPFPQGWPLVLNLSAFGLAAVAALRVPSPLALALGLYAGLVAVMLASGEAEYPIASMIALALHGLVPAALGALPGAGIRYAAGGRVSEA